MTLLNYVVEGINLLILLFLAGLGNFIPKHGNKIIFTSIPDFSESPRFLYEEIRKIPKFNNHKFIWIVKNDNKFMNMEKKDTTFVEKYSFEWIKEILSSKFVISDQGVPLWKSNNQTSILIWHGIPMKAIGKLRKNRTIVNRLFVAILRKKTNYFIVNSDFTKRLFSIIYGIDLNKFKSLGYPRNDCFFKPNDESLKHLKKLLDVPEVEAKKIIFYLPTFRDYDKVEDIKIKESIVLNKRLNNFFNENNIILIYKPHHVNEDLLEGFSSENIHLIKNEDLIRHNITLYDLLSCVDILVTDYSSVYFDFLLVDKPIVFYCPDLKKYKENRGFTLKPYYRWTPGSKAKNISELIESIESAIENPDKYRNQRKKIRNILFKHKDGRSAERIINLIYKYSQ